MPIYNVDVKAFINVQVEADDENAARREADRFVEGLSPGDGYADGWNMFTMDGVIHDSGELVVDGTSDVELDEDQGED